MIDAHFHLIEEDTEEYLALYVQRMNEQSIEGSVLYSYQHKDAPEDSAVREAVARCPGRFIPFLSQTVDVFAEDSWERCVRELESGFWKGVGELFLDLTNDEIVTYRDRSGVMVTARKPVPADREDNPLYLSLFRLCGKMNIPVVVHCMDGAVMERALQKYPDTIFIWAHADHEFYNSIPMNLMEKYPKLHCDFGVEFRFQCQNLYSDACPGWLMGHVERWREMCRRFPTRICWGTDLFCWEDLEPDNFANGMRAWRKIEEGLTKEVAEAVSGGNILRLTGMSEEDFRCWRTKGCSESD